MSDLNLLDDQPADGDQDNPDCFSHRAYADILRDVFLSNRAGINVGLFGKWGQGKSTVVSLLCDSLKDKAKVVVFNAWKARGDSVRRQMLLEVLRQIGSSEYEALRKFTQTNLPFALWPAQERDRFSDPNMQRFLVAVRHLPAWVQAAIVLAVLCMIVILAIVVGIWCGNGSAKVLASAIGFLGVLLVSSVTAVIGWFRETKRNELLIYTQPVSESQRLKYPEQFQRVFEQEVEKYCSVRGRLIVVVDDLDRCDPETVVEALAAIRQFSCGEHTLGGGRLDCQFMVPCDEQQVVQALEADGSRTSSHVKRYHDYHSEELLRKFFDVVVRMDRFLPQTLVSYAETLSSRINLDPLLAMELVGVVNPHDPRQVKKLLNALRVATERVHRSQKAGKLPEVARMPDFRQTLIVLTALRETVPSVYELICQDPTRLQCFESKSEDDITKEDAAKARRILQLAGAVSSLTAELLITGEWDPRLLHVQGGEAFILALRSYNQDQFNKVLMSASEQDQKTLLDVLWSYVVQIRTESELRKVFLLLGDYAAQDGEQRAQVVPSIQKCLLYPGVRSYLAAALDSPAILESMSGYVPVLSAPACAQLLGSVVNTFEAAPREKNAELKLLLSAVKFMEPVVKSRFIECLGLMFKGANASELQSTVEKISKALPEDTSGCSGMAPELAYDIIEQAWTDDASEKDSEKWPRPHLVSVFVGTDSVAAKRCFDKLFGANGKLQSAVNLTNAPLGVRPLWRAVRDLVKVMPKKDVRMFYRNIAQWLDNQNDPGGVRVIMDSVSSGITWLEPKNIDDIGDRIANYFMTAPTETWLLNYCDYPREGGIEDGAWDTLCRRVFCKCSERMQSAGSLEGWHRAFIQNAVNAAWHVSAEAENLLASRLRNGRQVDTWIPLLQPLIGQSSGNLKVVVEERIKGKGDLHAVLGVGVGVLWLEGIDSNIAVLLGEQLLEYGVDQLNACSADWSSLLDIKGCGIVIRTSVTHLSGKHDASWLAQREGFVTFLATGLKEAGVATADKFYQEVKKLILSSDNRTIMVGLRVIKSCGPLPADICSDVKRHETHAYNEISSLAKQIAVDVKGNPV